MTGVVDCFEILAALTKFREWGIELPEFYFVPWATRSRSRMYKT